MGDQVETKDRLIIDQDKKYKKTCFYVVIFIAG